RRATPKGHETFIFRTAPHQGLVPTSGPPCVQDTLRHPHGSGTGRADAANGPGPAWAEVQGCILVALLRTPAATSAECAVYRKGLGLVSLSPAVLRYGRSVRGQARTRVEVRWLLPRPPTAGSVIWRSFTTAAASTWRRCAPSSRPA